MNGAMLGEALTDFALDDFERGYFEITLSKGAHGEGLGVRPERFAEIGDKQHCVDRAHLDGSGGVFAHGVEHDFVLQTEFTPRKKRGDLAVEQAEILSLMLIDLQSVRVGVLEQFVVGEFLEAIVQQSAQLGLILVDAVRSGQTHRLVAHGEDMFAAVRGEVFAKMRLYFFDEFRWIGHGELRFRLSQAGPNLAAVSNDKTGVWARFLFRLAKRWVVLGQALALTMKTDPTFQRRDVLRTLSYGAVCAGMCGAGPMQWLLADVHAGETAVFRMSFAEFPQLKNSYGSVRLNVAGIPSASNQIVVTRMPGNQFYAVSAKCTHRGVAVDPFKKGKGLYCRAHGSQFDVDGRVVRGPARSALKSYEVSYDGTGSVSVAFPNLGYSVATSVVQTGAGDRVALSFKTISGMKYTVMVRDELGGVDAEAVQFATTPDGPLNVSRFTGNGKTATLYLQPVGDAGFIQVVRE